MLLTKISRKWGSSISVLDVDPDISLQPIGIKDNNNNQSQNIWKNASVSLRKIYVWEICIYIPPIIWNG